MKSFQTSACFAYLPNTTPLFSALFGLYTPKNERLGPNDVTPSDEVFIDGEKKNFAVVEGDDGNPVLDLGENSGVGHATVYHDRTGRMRKIETTLFSAPTRRK